jgi:spore maturation protein CgeB
VTYEFGNFKQLAELIEHYYRETGEREAIRRAGHERTKRDHTYTQRLEAMLGVLRSEGALL